MNKVTIIKNYRNTETLSKLSVEDVVKLIRSREYREQCILLHDEFLLAEAQQKFEPADNYLSSFTKGLPKVCFAVEMENKNKQRVTRAYNGFVLLEVNNLTGKEEAEAVRKGASQIPYTMLAFVGASGRSVKIVCRGELFDGGLPADDDIGRFHVNLYEKARMAYNMQLGVTIEKLQPTLDRCCFLSCDEEAFFAPACVPFYTDSSEMKEAVQPIVSNTPSYDDYLAMQKVYEFCLTKAYDETADIVDREERTHAVLTLLAGYCQESGLPMALAQRLALFNMQIGKEPELVCKVFENAYRLELEKQHRRRKNITKPLKHIPSETLLMMKVDMFLNANYELRKNVMRGVAEYRERTGLGFDFQDLTDEARNSITMRALSLGVKCWDRDISRYVNSNDVMLYEPMTDFLDHLPRWDGRDRVEELARRVKTDYE